jgi:rod shape-determining protein MreC
MESFLNRFRSLTTLLLVLFAQLILLAYQVKTDQDVRLLRVWVVECVTPLARLMGSLRGAVSDTFSGYFALVGTKQENLRLASELDRLKMENRQLRQELGTAERAEALRMFQTALPSRTVAVRVISAGAGINSKVVFVDRGASDGIRPGMAVINPDGVVGKVTAVFSKSSQVLLITDQGFSMGVVGAKSRAEGILKGTGGRDCSVEYVSYDQKVEVGEWFYTSGEDRVFPRGLPAGIVKRAGGDKTYKDIVLMPSGPSRGIEALLVVVEGVHQDVPEQARPVSGLLPVPARPDAAAAGQAATPAGKSATEADQLREQYRQRGPYGDNPQPVKPLDTVTPPVPARQTPENSPAPSTVRP